MSLFHMLNANNRIDEARVALENAIELDPNNEQLRNRLNGIKSR